MSSSLQSLVGFVKNLKRDPEFTKKFQLLLSFLNSHPGKLTPNLAAFLFDEIDRLWFDNLLGQVLYEEGLEIEFVLQVTGKQVPEGVAGFTTHVPTTKRITFTVHLALFENLFTIPSVGGIRHAYAIGDLQCTSFGACFLQIFFHEICHVFVYLVRILSKESVPLKGLDESHGALFFTLLSCLFHQTSKEHSLLKGFTSFGDTSDIVEHLNQPGDQLFAFAGAKKGWKKGIFKEYIDSHRVKVKVEGQEYTIPIMLVKPRK